MFRGADMSQDHFTTTTRTSWLQRLGSSIGGVLFGIALLVIGAILLAWNEGRSVTAIRTADDGGRRVVAAAPGRIDPANNGRLVHVSGPAAAPAPPTDPQTGVTTPALRLTRTVEHYQWIQTSRSETRTRLGGAQETVTTYDYAMDWSPRTVTSDDFARPDGHRNPEPVLTDADYPAAGLTLGSYRLSSEAAARLPSTTPVTLTAADAERAAALLGRKVSPAGDALYVGEDPARPRVGDARIRYVIAPAGPVSVMARQDGDRLDVFHGRHGDLFEIRAGVMDADAMVRQFKAENQVLTWVLRLVGFIMTVAGFGLMLHPVRVLADVLPLAGSILGAGIGLVSFAAGSLVSCVVIALAWFAFRPIVSIAVLAAGAAVVAGVIVLRRRRRPAPEQLTVVR
jgi:hypothetical protein